MMSQDSHSALPFATSADRLTDVQAITEDPYGSQIWKKLTCLGECQFGGKVYHTRNMDLDGGLGLPEDFVVKKIGKVNIFDKPGLECPANEIRASMLISQIQREDVGFSSNVIKVYGVFQDSRYFYLVTERCHQELYSAIEAGQQWSTNEIREICRQILESTAALHGKDIAHQDISVENFVLRMQDGAPSVRLIDLGQAVRNAQHLAVIDGRGAPGKPTCTSPELWSSLTGRIGTHYSAKKHDVFQVGVSIFILLVGTFPFHVGQAKRAFNGRLNHWLFPDLDADRCMRLRVMLEDHWRVMDRVPTGALDLLERLLAPNPDLRITAAEALEHPWFATAPAEVPAEEQTPDDCFPADEPGTTTPTQPDTSKPEDLQAATASTAESTQTAPAVRTVSASVAVSPVQAAAVCVRRAVIVASIQELVANSGFSIV